MREREMLVSAVTVAYASVIFFAMWELSSLQTNLLVTRFAAVRAIEEGSQSVFSFEVYVRCYLWHYHDDCQEHTQRHCGAVIYWFLSEQHHSDSTGAL